MLILIYNTLETFPTLPRHYILQYESGTASNDLGCTANTVCGKQVDGIQLRDATGDASRTVAGTCADCDSDTYAINGTSDCKTNTVCGKQVVGTARLTGASRTVAGTCADCDTDTYATDATSDCRANTVCGKQVGGTARLTGASSTVAGICAECADQSFASDGATDCSELLSNSPSSTKAEFTTEGNSPSSTKAENTTEGKVSSATKININKNTIVVHVIFTLFIVTFIIGC